MDTSRESTGAASKAAQDAITKAYEELAARLRVISQTKFHIPEEDAEQVVNTVFEAYLRRRATVHDLERYLVASVCNASRDYWRAKKGTEEVPIEAEYAAPATADAEERLVRSMTIAVQLTRLGDECCEALYLYHLGGYSGKEIAEKMGTTEQNAWQILSKCRRRAKELLGGLMEGKTWTSDT
ncbi:MAG: sigma-70 family RNA polymerase sigma factor [Acidobacteria bacterium]|nr:sigma-70 family RNA polymerase sigma factor [Acidobacteriota bacterium]